MVDQRSWVHMLSVISRGCVWEIDVWVMPALLQRLKGMGGQPVSAQTICCTLHQIGLHGCHHRRKPLIKMMHKKARKQFAEDKQTKDMAYWKHVLWSDETKINLFGSDGVKRVWQATRWGVQRQVSCLQSSMVVGVSWSGAAWVLPGTGELQFIIFTYQFIPSLRRLGCRAVFQHDDEPQTHLQDDHCLAKEAEGKGDGLAKYVSRPKPY